MTNELIQAEMSGSPQNAKWERAVSALLTERNREAAAKKAGVGGSTLRRWLADEKFRKLYGETRRQALDHAVGRLLEASNLAVDALRNSLLSEKPSIQLRAAVSILELAFKGSEFSEISDRLNFLEKALNRHKENLRAPV